MSLHPAQRAAWLAERAADQGLTLQLIDMQPGHSPRARVYRIHVQPALWGGASLVREWGRLGAARHHPRRLVTHHDDDHVMAAALYDVVSRRLQRGYVPTRGVAVP